MTYGGAQGWAGVALNQAEALQRSGGVDSWGAVGVMPGAAEDATCSGGWVYQHRMSGDVVQNVLHGICTGERLDDSLHTWLPWAPEHRWV